jgi:hypothetical protein
VLTVLATVLARRLDARDHPLRGTTRAFRGCSCRACSRTCWPRWLGWSHEAGREHCAAGLRVIETLSWLAGIVVALSLVTNTALIAP